MSGRYPDWAVQGRDWPHHEASQFVDAGGYRWHVQRMGQGGNGRPRIMLIHGTGAATHSWRDVMPMLAEKAELLTMDLPGHGFTRARGDGRVSLPGMAQSVTELAEVLDFRPDLVIGHSAGAAIAVQMQIASHGDVPIVALTPALMPFPGLAAKLFPQLAMMLFANPVVSIIVSRLARGPGEVDRFLKRATGSAISREGVEFYQRLFATSGHCDGALRMMANWDLATFSQRLGELAAPVLLVEGGRDKAIPGSSIRAADALLADAQLLTLDDLGHLAHEEAPDRIVAVIREFARRQNLAL